MKPILILAAALSLSACASVPGQGSMSPELLDKMVKQYGERCDSHFWGNTGLGAALGFDINCKRKLPAEPAQ